MKILAIIVSYNFEHWINQCLGSLRQSIQPVDIVVIDNCSLDATTSIIEKHYPEVRLIKNEKNLGFGHANNIGMRIALQEEYNAVLLLNQDAWIDAQTIGTLANLLSIKPQYGIISPVHLNGKGNKLDQGFATYIGITDLTKITKVPVIPATFINAACWMIPTSVLRVIGGFSPLFYHYGEDKDYINRLKYHGYLLGYSPNVFGYHDREYREVTPATFFRSEQVYLLSEYANINYSFMKAFGYSILAGLKKASKALIHNKNKDAIKYLDITF
ncbi:MAG: glycosyltransferase family 2 protein, partial [Bacteroidaceae bacterium]